MRLARYASFVHKWLALLISLQILFWVVSGLFFTLFPIERIRSENLVRAPTIESPNFSAVADLASIHDAQGRTPTKLGIERRSGSDVIVATYADGPPALLDAATLHPLSPLDADAAARIAQAHLTLTDQPTSVTRVSEESAEYKGLLPAWRVQFAQENLSVYVAADTGTVTARRSDLWRLYDTLWALHIMDWRNHEDFNHPLIIAVTAITLISVIAGIVLIPYRIRLRTSRRRPAVSES